MKIAIIGAGNGGQTMAGHLSMMGFEVSLYDIDVEKMDALRKRGNIQLEGCLQGYGKIECFTTDIKEAVAGAEIIMVTTVANAHRAVAKSLTPYLVDGQIIVLNPGRTCGALVFKQALKQEGCTVRIYLAEAQTLVYACRVIENGHVNVIGIKDEVLLSGLPAKDTDYILDKLNLFNAATIERNEMFWFYRDMTDQVAEFIEKFDAERLAVGKAYGVDLLSVREWIKFAYKDTQGETLRERMRNNPAYHDIKSPSTIFTRQLTEDIPTGVLPIMELGKAAGVATPLLNSMVNICEALLNMDLHTSGRSLKNLGLEGMSKAQILNYITHEA